MNGLTNKFYLQSDGATTVEFAIVLPVLLSLIFGAIEFSLYLYNRQVLTNACREAARTGVIMRIRTDPTVTTEEEQIVKDKFAAILNSVPLITFGSAGTPTPQVIFDLGPDNRITFGDGLTVQADYTYDFLFLSNLGIGPITIHAFSKMKME